MQRLAIHTDGSQKQLSSYGAFNNKNRHDDGGNDRANNRGKYLLSLKALLDTCRTPMSNKTQHRESEPNIIEHNSKPTLKAKRYGWFPVDGRAY